MKEFHIYPDAICCCLQEICISDAKFNRTLQDDKYIFQIMIADLHHIAMHYKQHFHCIFIHRSHGSNIDFMFSDNINIVESRWIYMFIADLNASINDSIQITLIVSLPQCILSKSRLPFNLRLITSGCIKDILVIFPDGKFLKMLPGKPRNFIRDHKHRNSIHDNDSIPGILGFLSPTLEDHFRCLYIHHFPKVE